MVGYFCAKLMSKLLRNHQYIIRYFRKKGINIGNNVHVYSDITSSESYLISIGSDTTISNGVQLITHDNSLEKLHIGFSDSFGTINIGNNCFIGAKTIILGGVKIGDNTIVGAGSVVTKSFPNNTVVAGNPAKVICTTTELKEKMNNRFNVSIEGLTLLEKRTLLLLNKDRLSQR